MKILDRYVFKEMVSPFLISLFAFLVLWEGTIILEYMAMFIQFKAPMGLVVQFLAAKAPWAVWRALPLAVLFGASLSVSRLGHDNEITAVRMAGVRIPRIMISIIALGLFTSGVMLCLGEWINPWAERRSERIRMLICSRQPMLAIREKVYFEVDGHHFYVERVLEDDDGSVSLRNVLVYQPPKVGEYPVLITAKEGANKGRLWILRDGVQHKLGADGLTEYELKFDETELDLDLSAWRFLDAQVTSQQMGVTELGRQIATYGRIGIDATQMKVDWHFKLSDPFACLIYALCAAPLSFRFSRYGGYAGIFLAIVVYFLYWNNQILGRYLGMMGVIPPVVAGWSQNIIFGLVGLYLVRREK